MILCKAPRRESLVNYMTPYNEHHNAHIIATREYLAQKLMTHYLHFWPQNEMQLLKYMHRHCRDI